jgi:hypothetical protein
MNSFADFKKIAPYLTNPLVLSGLAIFLFFGIAKLLIQSKIIPPLSKDGGTEITRTILNYGFILALLSVISGVFLQAFSKLLDHKDGSSVVSHLKNRAEIARTNVFSEACSDLAMIGTSINTVETFPLDLFEKWEKRRVNETESAFRERSKTHYRDYSSQVGQLISLVRYSDQAFKAQQNDLMSLENDSLSRFKNSYQHLEWANDALQSFCGDAQHQIGLDKSDVETHAAILSQRDERLAKARAELCEAAASLCLVATSPSDFGLVSYGLQFAGIQIDFKDQSDGSRACMQKNIEYRKAVHSALATRTEKLKGAAQREVSRRISDPYLLFLRKTLGLTATLSDADAWSLDKKTFNDNASTFPELMTLASTSFLESDGDYAVKYIEKAMKTPKLSPIYQRYLAASVERLKHPDDFGETLGFMVMELEKGGLFEASGIRQADILLSLDNHPLMESGDISKALARTSDHSFIVGLLRDGKRIEIPITPGRSAGVSLVALVCFDANRF